MLFPIPNSLNIIVSRAEEDTKKIAESTTVEEDEEGSDEILLAWDIALQATFSQIENYNIYLSKDSAFATHQGVKGLEFERVMVIIDDEEAKGFSFSYDKLFGSKELTDGDNKNLAEGKENGIDKTRRLFNPKLNLKLIIMSKIFCK